MRRLLLLKDKIESDTIILHYLCAARQARPSRTEISQFWERAERYVQQNAEAARIILLDADRCGGETAGLVIWARMALARAGGRRAA